MEENLAGIGAWSLVVWNNDMALNLLTRFLIETACENKCLACTKNPASVV